MHEILIPRKNINNNRIKSKIENKQGKNPELKILESKHNDTIIGREILETLNNISSLSNHTSTISHFKTLQEKQFNDIINLLSSKIDILKHKYSIIDVFMLEEQQQFIDDIINGRKDDLVIRVKNYMKQSIERQEEKEFWREWYPDLVQSKPDILSRPVLEQVTLLFTETEFLGKFTDKTKVYGKTLFKKCGLSPFILSSSKKVSEYRGYKNITEGLQYFLARLYDDRDTFGKLEKERSFVIPYIKDGNIQEIRMVNTEFGKYDKYLSKDSINDIGEINPEISIDIEEEETRGNIISLDVAEKYIIDYLTTNTFSETSYRHRRLTLKENERTSIPIRLSSVMRPIIQDRMGTTLIYNVKYYKAIWNKDKNTQHEIENNIHNLLEIQKNDYDNIRGVIIYKKIIEDSLLTSASIGKILERNPYNKVGNYVYNAIQTAHKYYVGSLEEISINPFIDAINKRYNDIKVHNGEAFYKASTEITRLLSPHK